MMIKNYIDELSEEYYEEQNICEGRHCNICYNSDCATYNHLRELEEIIENELDNTSI